VDAGERGADRRRVFGPDPRLTEVLAFDEGVERDGLAVPRRDGVVVSPASASALGCGVPSGGETTNERALASRAFHPCSS
jgi:hypothetical protein